MSEQNTYLVEVDKVEYELEVLGDEVVVSDFSEVERNVYQMFKNPNSDSLRQFLSPRKPLFSFPATPELKALIFEGNEYFDTHGENALEGVEERLTQLAEPFIRHWLDSKRDKKST